MTRNTVCLTCLQRKQTVATGSSLLRDTVKVPLHMVMATVLLESLITVINNLLAPLDLHLVGMTPIRPRSTSRERVSRASSSPDRWKHNLFRRSASRERTRQYSREKIRRSHSRDRSSFRRSLSRERMNKRRSVSKERMGRRSLSCERGGYRRSRSRERFGFKKSNSRDPPMYNKSFTKGRVYSRINMDRTHRRSTSKEKTGYMET